MKDHFYTRPILAHELFRMNTTLTGTVMCNRKDMPAAVKSKKQKKGDVDKYMKRKMVVIQWTNKWTITTLAANSMVSIPSQLVILNAHAWIGTVVAYTCIYYISESPCASVAQWATRAAHLTTTYRMCMYVHNIA